MVYLPVHFATTDSKSSINDLNKITKQSIIILSKENVRSENGENSKKKYLLSPTQLGHPHWVFAQRKLRLVA